MLLHALYQVTMDTLYQVTMETVYTLNNLNRIGWDSKEKKTKDEGNSFQKGSSGSQQET